jgi:prophage antirepressor-like protein
MNIIPASQSLFNFGDLRVRAHRDNQGRPWFVAADICAAVGIRNSRQSLTSLDSDEKGVISTDTLGGKQESATVNESGLYALILRSRKPEAKTFRKWITSIVLPTLRQDGAYIVGEENSSLSNMSMDEMLAQIAQLKARVDAVCESKLLRWSKHYEEKNDRRDALRSLRGSSKRRQKRTHPEAQGVASAHKSKAAG